MDRLYKAEPQKPSIALVLGARARERFSNLCGELAIIANAFGIDAGMVGQTVAAVAIDAKGEKKIRDLQKALASL